MQAFGAGGLRPSAPRTRPMMPQQANAIHPQQMQPGATHQEAMHDRAMRERARHKSEKPVDRNLPDTVDDLVFNQDVVAQYNKLRAFERRVDSTMMRKRMDMQDSANRPAKRYGTMRIWVSNTVEDQPWQASGMDPSAFDFSSNVDAKFRVRIVGKLIDEPLDEDSNHQIGQTDKDADDAMDADDGPAAKRAKLSAAGPNQRKKLSHFFKGIAVDFDRPAHLQPDGYTRIEWKRPEVNFQTSADLPKEADFDSLEFERKSDENINVTINLTRDEQPEKYRLDPDLAQLLDMEEAGRTEVLMGIWEYIKLNNLPHDAEGRNVRADRRLAKAIKHDTIYFPQLPERLKMLLFERPPLELQYTIRVDKDFHEQIGGPKPTIYDVPVPLDDPLATQIRQAVSQSQHKETLQQINALDAELALTIQGMKESQAKHAFLTNMSTDPANFVKRWMSSQKRDLDVIKGAGAWGEEDWQDAAWRKGGADGPWASTEVQEGVGGFLTRRDGQR